MPDEYRRLRTGQRRCCAAPAMRSAERPEDADVILLNTCAIREHAEERVLGRLSDLARLKQARPELKLGLLGCMAQHNRAALVEKAPWLDLVAGPDTYRRLPEMLGAAALIPPSMCASIAPRPTPISSPDVRRGRARLRHRDARMRQVLRLLRGALRARPRAQRAARMISCARFASLAARGVKEMVLLGQTVNAYRFERSRFRRAAADGRGASTASSGFASPRRIRAT